MSCKAIIFDLDGTLLNTLKDLAFSVNTVLRQEGFSEHPVDAYRYFIGEGIDMLVQKALPPERSAQQKLKEITKAVKEEYSRRWSEYTRPYSGVAEMLDYFEENQVPKAIFSNKTHEFTILTVEQLLPGWKFVSVCGIQPGVPRKPDPTGVLEIADKMKIKPEKILYLGDTNTDMQTAMAGGFYAVGALWGFRPAEELLESGARILAETPQDVIDIFNKS